MRVEALLALFLVFRLSAILSWRPGGYVVDWSERYFFAGWLRYVDAGYLPYRDFWMEYPPLLPWFGILTYWASQAFPPWRDPTFWFSLTTGIPLLVVDALILLLIVSLASRVHGRQLGLLAGALWAALLAPLYYFLSGYDGPAVLAILAAIWVGVKGTRGKGVEGKWAPDALGGRRDDETLTPDLSPTRERELDAAPIRPSAFRLPPSFHSSLFTLHSSLAGLVLALGFQYKIVPAVIGPALLLWFWHRSRRAAVTFLASAGVASGLIAAPFLLANPAMTIASYASILSRSSWETIWALLDGYYGGGLVAPIETRFDPSIATLPQHSSTLPWTIVGILAVFVLGFVLTRRYDWRRPVTLVGLAFLSLLIFLIASKGWSAQFIVYPLPFILILWPTWRGASYAVLLSAVNFLEWPFWLAMFGENAAILSFLVLTRTALLALLVAETLILLRGVARLSGAEDNPPSIQPSAFNPQPSPLNPALVLVAVVIAAGAVLMGRTYVVAAYDRDPYQGLMGALGERGGTVLFTDSTLYYQLRPFIGWRQPIVFAPEPPDERLAGRIGSLDSGISLVFAGTDADRGPNGLVEGWLSERFFPASEQWLDNARIARFVGGSAGPERSIAARLGPVITLTEAAVESPVRVGQPARILVRWTTVARPDRDYQVFLHVVDGAGALVTQRDGPPVAGRRPTTGWNQGEIIVDRRTVSVDRPGTYTVRVGLYDSIGARLAVGGADFVELGPLKVEG